MNGVLSTIIRQEIYVVGCGRTDTGVHARMFYAHFELDGPLADTNQLVYKCNRMLPKEIAAQQVFEVDSEAHTRFSAVSRTYEYMMVRHKDPFSEKLAWEFRDALDIEAMNRAAAFLLTVDDFTSFSKSNTQTETNLCDVTTARWEETSEQYRFVVKANRFLRNMVRALVGTLVEVGLGKMSQEEFEAVVKAKNRSEAGTSVPAHGLYLIDVEYPKGMIPGT